MNNIDRQYKELLDYILNFGVSKSDRTGTGTISVFGRQIRHKMSEGFPILTTKRVHFKSVVSELLWFLRGDTNIKYLVDNGCHIWDGDAWANYQRKMLEKFMEDTTIAGYAITNKEEFINKIKTDDEFAKKWGELGPVYGKQWRKWRGQDGMIGEKDENGTRIITWNQIDQIANLIRDLKTNPDSRRLMVSAWNVGELDNMVLPPCHYGFQVYTRELNLGERGELFKKTYPDKSVDDFAPKGMEVQSLTTQLDTRYNNANIPKRSISLMWNQRSVDTFLGLPFNIASYALLLEIIAKEVNMVPEEMIGNLGDVHLYNNHIEQAKEQLSRTPFNLPTLKHMKTDEFYKSLSEDLSLITHIDSNDFVIENYESHSAIKAPLSN